MMTKRVTAATTAVPASFMARGCVSPSVAMVGQQQQQQQQQPPYHVGGVPAFGSAQQQTLLLSHNHHHPYGGGGGGGGNQPTFVGGIAKVGLVVDPSLPPPLPQQPTGGGGGGGMSPRGQHAYPPARPLQCTTIVAWLALILAFVMSVLVIVLYFNWSGGPLTIATTVKNEQTVARLHAQIRAMNRRQRLHEQRHLKRNKAGRIIGGTPVDPTFASGPLVKYQVGLEIDLGGGSVSRCGGSIISPNFVLTAAHCVHNLGTHTTFNPANITVIPGTDYSDRTLAVHGQAVFVHPTYVSNQPSPAIQDIALIRINGTFTFTSTVQPVQLAQVSSCGGTGCKATDVQYIASGYGFTVSTEDGGADLSDILLYVDLQFVSDTLCEQRAETNGRPPVATGAICAGPTANFTSTGGKDTCQGDSGGPLVHPGDGGTPYIQVAVVSTGTAVTNPLCGSVGDYGEYAGVVYNRNWIDLAVAGNIVPTKVASSAVPTGTFLLLAIVAVVLLV